MLLPLQTCPRSKLCSLIFATRKDCAATLKLPDETGSQDVSRFTPPRCPSSMRCSHRRAPRSRKPRLWWPHLQRSPVPARSGSKAKCTTGHTWSALRRCLRVTAANPTAQIVGLTLWLGGQIRIEGFVRVAKLERCRAALAERDCTVKTRASAGMARAGALLVDPQPDCVLVGIDPQFDHVLNMAGRLAFLPQRLARAAEVPGFAACDGFAKSFLIHVRNHQHVARFRIGDNCRDQAIGVEFGRERQALFEIVRG